MHDHLDNPLPLPPREFLVSHGAFLEGLDERHAVAVLGADILSQTLLDNGLGYFEALLLVLAQHQFATHQQLKRVGPELGVFLVKKLGLLSGVLTVQLGDLATHELCHHLPGDDLVVHLSNDAVPLGGEALPHCRAGEEHSGKDGDQSA